LRKKNEGRGGWRRKKRRASPGLNPASGTGDMQLYKFSRPDSKSSMSYGLDKSHTHRGRGREKWIRAL